jgi:hypothetical protein
MHRYEPQNHPTLQLLRINGTSFVKVEATYEASEAEMTLSVIHSLMRKSIKA